MSAKIQFRFDVENRILFARPRWEVQSPDACEEWVQEWLEAMKPFSHKVDCVLLLDDFKVDRTVASKWGENRALLTDVFFRYSYRVHQSANMSTLVHVSGIRHNASSNEAHSEEEAVARILHDREAAGDELPEPIDWERVKAMGCLVKSAA